MSVRDNRISAVHPTGRQLLQTIARLAAWAEGRQLGLTTAQSDLIADAALNRVIETLESWERASEPAYVAEPDPPIDLSKLPLSGDWTPYDRLFAPEDLETFLARPRLPMIAPVAVGPLCPRWNFQAPRHPKCNKPLQDYKCPQHGLIREAMPK